METYEVVLTSLVNASRDIDLEKPMQVRKFFANQSHRMPDYVIELFYEIMETKDSLSETQWAILHYAQFCQKLEAQFAKDLWK